MVSCSKVSETLQQQVVQTKVNSSHSKKSWSFQIWDFENIASLQCHKLIQVPPKGWSSTKTNAQEDKIIQRISVSSWFNTAAGIARQFGAEQGKDLSWHIVTRCWTESPLLSSAERIKRPLANWSKVHFSDERFIYLDPMGNIMFKYVKQSVKGGGGSVDGLGNALCSWGWDSNTDTRQSECRCLSEPPAATCSSFPAFITQSAS